MNWNFLLRCASFCSNTCALHLLNDTFTIFLLYKLKRSSLFEGQNVRFLDDRCSGQVSSGRLVSVLIGHPGDGVHFAIRSRVRVASPHDSSYAFGVLGVDLFLGSALVDFNAIFALKSVEFIQN